MGLNRNGNSNGYGNGYSSKLRIPGIYEANDESDQSEGSYQIKQSPKNNKRKTHINHHD